MSLRQNQMALTLCIAAIYIMTTNSTLNAGNCFSSSKKSHYTEKSSLLAMKEFVKHGIAELNLYDLPRMVHYLNKMRAEKKYTPLCKNKEEFNTLYTLVTKAHTAVLVSLHHAQNDQQLTLEDIAQVIHQARMEQQKLLTLQDLARQKLHQKSAL